MFLLKYLSILTLTFGASCLEWIYGLIFVEMMHYNFEMTVSFTLPSLLQIPVQFKSDSVQTVLDIRRLMLFDLRKVSEESPILQRYCGSVNVFTLRFCL